MFDGNGKIGTFHQKGGKSAITTSLLKTAEIYFRYGEGRVR